MITYWMVTNHGHWGKGETLEEAAANASVSATKTSECIASIYAVDSALMTDVHVDGWGNFCWTWTPEGHAIGAELRSAVSGLSKRGKYHVWLRGKTLSMVPVKPR